MFSSFLSLMYAIKLGSIIQDNHVFDNSIQEFLCHWDFERSESGLSEDSFTVFY